MIDPEQPRGQNFRQGARLPPTTPAPARPPAAAPPAARPGRQLNARQQARQDALAALTPQQVANRARRQAQRPASGGDAGGGSMGGSPVPPAGPAGQTPPPGMGGPGSFVQVDAPHGPMGTPPPGGGGYPGPGYPPAGSGGPGGPGGAYPPQQGGGYGDAYSFTDPFQQFLSAVPVMNMNRDKQISDAMAQAGFDGNRYGSFAAGKAAEIGGQTALQEDALLWSALSDYGNQTQNRALQASGLGLQAADMQDRMAQNRLMLPFQIGQYEQNRQDQFSNTAFNDWSQNRLGWMGPLLQAAMSQGAGSPGQIYQTQTPGSPGAVDYLPLLMSLFGGG